LAGCDERGRAALNLTRSSDGADAEALSGIFPELPGCASARDTGEGAKQNIKEAIEL
jgi:predicted RNase H-like HicB family nuclease